MRFPNVFSDRDHFGVIQTFLKTEVALSRTRTVTTICRLRWAPFALTKQRMLLWREKLPAVLVDHAHLERKAATTALNLEKYRDLYARVEELNAIAIEELQHFQLVL